MLAFDRTSSWKNTSKLDQHALTMKFSGSSIPVINSAATKRVTSESVDARVCYSGHALHKDFRIYKIR